MTRSTPDRRSSARTAAALGVTTALTGCGGSDDGGTDGAFASDSASEAVDMKDAVYVE